MLTIKESIEIVRLKRLTGVIKNLPAYTLAVLKKDYVPTSKLNTDAKTSPQKKDISSNSQITTKYTKTVQSYINSLSTTQKDSLVKEFEKEKITNPILQDLYKKKGIDEVVFRVMFEGWINEKIKNN